MLNDHWHFHHGQHNYYTKTGGGRVAECQQHCGNNLMGTAEAVTDSTCLRWLLDSLTFVSPVSGIPFWRDPAVRQYRITKQPWGCHYKLQPMIRTTKPAVPGFNWVVATNARKHSQKSHGLPNHHLVAKPIMAPTSSRLILNKTTTATTATTANATADFWMILQTIVCPHCDLSISPSNLHIA